MNLVNLNEAPKKSKIMKNYDVYDYYKSVFNEWDKDGDGFISIGELKYLIASNENVNLTKEVIDALLSKFDCNNDELLDFEEFLMMINHPSFKLTFQKLTQKYLKYVIIPRTRATVRLRRTATSTGAYEKEIKCKKHTVGLILISSLQIILHYINYNSKTTYKDIGDIEDSLEFKPCNKLEIYRYITYMFVHSNDWHLYMNVLMQLLLGVPLEMVHSWRLIVIYFIGGVLGCITHTVFHLKGPLVGSSGGVYSFFTAHLATVVLNWREMSHPVVSLLIFTLIVMFDVTYQVVRKYYMNISDPSDAGIACHFGGIVTGFLLGVLIFRNLRVTKQERFLWFFCLGSLVAYFCVLVVLDVHNSNNTKLIEFCLKSCNNQTNRIHHC